MPGIPPCKETILEPTYSEAAALAATASGPLTTYLTGFVSSLIDQSYSARSVQHRAYPAVDFDRWMAFERHRVEDVDEGLIDSYHRSRKSASGRLKRWRNELAALHQLLAYLRVQGIIVDPAAVRTPVYGMLAAFEHHLVERQGLAAATVETYLRHARDFLVHRFGADSIDLKDRRSPTPQSWLPNLGSDQGPTD